VLEANRLLWVEILKNGENAAFARNDLDAGHPICKQRQAHQSDRNKIIFQLH
jgi:hypothetical protein